MFWPKLGFSDSTGGINPNLFMRGTIGKIKSIKEVLKKKEEKDIRRRELNAEREWSIAHKYGS